MQGKKNTALLVTGLLLTAFGDLRNIIGADGYWAAWGALVVLLSNNLLKRNACSGALPKLFYSGIYLLLFSALLAAAYNSNSTAAYQAAKFIVIGFVAWVVSKSSSNIKEETIYHACLIAIFSQLSIFLISKLYFSDWSMVLGDDRQGSLIAYPGVMWKTGAYLAPFVMIHVIIYGFSVTSLLALLAATYLVLADGSRTALLILAFSSFCFFFIMIKKSSRALVIVFPVGVLFLLLALLNFDVLSNVYQNATKEIFVSASRFDDGDVTRQKMYSDGVQIVIDCLPFGCGFGETAVETGEGLVVVHNAYLSIAGDFGFLGVLGFFIVLFSSPVKIINLTNRRMFDKKTVKLLRRFILIVPLCIFVAYFFHPYSTEMSDWGWIAYLSSWSVSVAKEVTQEDSNI